MRGIVRWATRNVPAINTIMIAVLAVGIISLFSLRREVFPEFELEIILVSVPYPGATPSEVEDGICTKVEEAVRAVDGIKKITSVAKENAGFVILELETGINAAKVLDEVRSEVDRIPSFPENAEEPEVKQITLRTSAIRLAVIGPETSDPQGELKLRHLAEKIRDDLTHLPEISQAEITGAKPFQIVVEISEKELEKYKEYGLTLEKVAEKIRLENLELPGGVLKANAQQLLIKGRPKAVTGDEIAKLPLIVDASGNVALRVGDIANVRDEFDDVTSITRVNGKPARVITISRTSREDLLAVTNAVHRFVAETPMPPGYELVAFEDRSIDVKDRINLLAKNGLQGLFLVLVALALFLDTRLAFWVAMGIPFSVLSAAAVLLAFGHTLNMLTLFAFLMALGIVVDDAIVIGENIYAHRQRGIGFVQAAIDGTLEVLPSVATSVGTTVVAFMPMFFVTGTMGKFFAILPLAMISMLLVSLLEAFTLLPCHLAHSEDPDHPKPSLFARACALRRRMPLFFAWTIGWGIVTAGALLTFLLYPFRRLEQVLRLISGNVNKLLHRFIENAYLPFLRWVLRYPGIVVCSAVAVLLTSFGFVRGGAVPFIIFPSLDSKSIIATIEFPDGTPEQATDRATTLLERAIMNVNARYAEQGTPLVILTHRSVGYSTRQTMAGRSPETGAHVGSVSVELVDPAFRDVTSDQILAEWRAEWKRLNPGGSFPGVDSVQFASNMMGPGGKAIEFRLLAPPEHFGELERIVEKVKAKLATYDGVHDINDDSQPGKTELVYRVKDDAVALGISQGDLVRTIHAAFFGEEVMRLQRGRHEIKVMVRYPPEERRKLHSLDQIRFRTPQGDELPVSELAEVRLSRSYREINRVDQLRSITITADVDESRGNAQRIVSDLQREFVPDLLAEHPWLRVRWEGQQQQTVESMQSLFVGLAVAFVVMFVLLTVEFRSYGQPLMILAIIPFGAVGAIFGHFLMGLPLTMFSVLGLVALTGVVVNDSIVLIDFINHRVRAGMPLHDAIHESGRRRLRPVLLTSLTTVVGLLPLLLERSFQAQVLIPMAVSLCFGLMTTTVLVLILVPTFYLIYARIFPPKVDGDEENDSVRHLTDEACDTDGNGRGQPVELPAAQRQPA